MNKALTAIFTVIGGLLFMGSAAHAQETVVEDPTAEPVVEEIVVDTLVVEDVALTVETVVDDAKKVFVCKYVGTPGVDERLQTGNNPISVSVNAIKDYNGVGSYFNDAHGRSYVLSEDTRTGGGQEGEPNISGCPPPVVPPDVCPNIDGNQATVPDGLTVVNGDCVEPPCDTADPNGECYTPPPPPCDQTDPNGGCYVPPPPPPPVEPPVVVPPVEPPVVVPPVVEPPVVVPPVVQPPVVEPREVVKPPVLVGPVVLPQTTTRPVLAETGSNTPTLALVGLGLILSGVLFTRRGIRT